MTRSAFVSPPSAASQRHHEQSNMEASVWAELVAPPPLRRRSEAHLLGGASHDTQFDLAVPSRQLNLPPLNTTQTSHHHLGNDSTFEHHPSKRRRREQSQGESTNWASPPASIAESPALPRPRGPAPSSM